MFPWRLSGSSPPLISYAAWCVWLCAKPKQCPHNLLVQTGSPPHVLLAAQNLPRIFFTSFSPHWPRGLISRIRQHRRSHVAPSIWRQIVGDDQRDWRRQLTLTECPEKLMDQCCVPPMHIPSLRSFSWCAWEEDSVFSAFFSWFCPTRIVFCFELFIRWFEYVVLYKVNF